MVWFIGASVVVKALIIKLDYHVLMWISLALVVMALPFIWKLRRFTLILLALCASLTVYGLFSTPTSGWLVLTFSVPAGLFLQAFMSSSLERKVVIQSDRVMQGLRI